MRNSSARKDKYGSTDILKSVWDKMALEEIMVARKYTRRVRVASGEDREFQCRLVVGVQQFDVGIPDERQPVDWTRWMLAKAIIALKEETMLMFK